MKTAAKIVANGLVCFVALLVLPLLAVADTAAGGADTVFADVARVNDHSFTITISCVNSKNIVGIAVPLKMSAGNVRVVADSADYAGGRVEKWSYLGFRPDSSIQCVTLGMVASVGPTEKFIEPGNGRLTTVYVSSLDGAKIDDLVVDTATTDPGNRLQFISQRDPKLAEEERSAAAFNSRIYTPTWVVRKVK